MSSDVKYLGVDLAKDNFELHGQNERGHTVFKKTVHRSKFFDLVRQLNPKLVGVEACSGAHHVTRTLLASGIETKIIAAQFVKPFVKSNKNDRVDAEAICEAVQRPSMRFVPVKQVIHQDIQCLHRIRSRKIKERTALVNEIRGFLLEYGIVVAKSRQKLQSSFPSLFEHENLSDYLRGLLNDLYLELLEKNDSIKQLDVRVKDLVKTIDVCKDLMSIPGVGQLTATAVFSSASDPKVFKNGRHFSAWLGLVPKHTGTGGKERLLGISKRGDKYVRSLLVQGAQTYLNTVGRKTDPLSFWSKNLMDKRGRNITAVAVANKNARTMWRILSAAPQ